MSNLYWILEPIWFYKEVISLVLGLFTLLYIFYGIGRAGNFIAQVIFERQDGWFPRTVNWLRGIGRVLLLSWYAPGLAFAFPRRRFNAARYYTELQILLPQKALPNRRDYNEREYRRRLADTLREERERRTRIRESLSKRLAEEPGVLIAAVHWVRSKLRWNREREKPLGPIEIEDFPELDESRTKIKHYFEALERRSGDKLERRSGDKLERRSGDKLERRSGDKDDNKFLTEAKFQSGYIAPIFLITGLVSRFTDDDGWKLVLDNYRQLIDKDSEYSEELRELRSFLFNCWLMWGPSIQPCSCDYWKSTQRDADSNGDLMVQYGYGDESNSIDILVKGGRGPAFETAIKANLNKDDDDQRNRPFNVAAARFVATGRFRWGPSLKDDEICTAQQLVRGGSDSEQRQPLNGRVVLECRHNDVTVAASQSPGYYAYLWIMFLIQDAQGRCFHEKDDRWKNLLVFFEHANIADAGTYHTLKEQLVAKTCMTLSKVLGDRSTTRGPLRLKYVCSFDGTNCGEHKALFQPRPLARDNPAGGVTMEEVTILSLLRRSIDALPERHVLRSDRLLLPNTTRPVADNEYSSCHLPEIVEKFYAALDASLRARHTS